MEWTTLAVMAAFAEQPNHDVSSMAYFMSDGIRGRRAVLPAGWPA